MSSRRSPGSARRWTSWPTIRCLTRSWCGQAPPIPASRWCCCEKSSSNLPETELVQVDTEWVQRFHAILDIVRQAIVIGSARCSARRSSSSSATRFASTSRTGARKSRSRSSSARAMVSCGARSCGPASGTACSVGLLAIGLVSYGLYPARAAPRTARRALPERHHRAQLSMSGKSARSSVSACCLGLVGSWFAAARHMRRIEPR